MKIEIPKIEDLDIINNLALQVHECHVNWNPSLFEHTDCIFSKEDLEFIIADKEMYIAKIDEEIVGYILFTTREGKKNGYRYRKVLCIDAIGVDAEYRNKGIGTELLEFIKDYAKNNGYTDLNLTVNEENTNAIHLYEKMGFKVKNISYTLDLR